VVILTNCKDDLEREFYIRMTQKFGWTKDVLIHQIDNQSYEKTLMGQTNFDKAVSAKIRDQAKLAVKGEYTFDFLELGAAGDKELPEIQPIEQIPMKAQGTEKMGNEEGEK